MKSVFVLALVVILSFGTLHAVDVKVKRIIKLKLDVPFIDFEYTRTWKGTDSKKYCPSESPFDCEYSVTVGALTSNETNSDSADVDVEIDVEVGSKTAFIKLVDCSDIPIINDVFIMHQLTIQTNDPFVTSGTVPHTMYFPEQEMIYIPEADMFLGYYFDQSNNN